MILGSICSKDERVVLYIIGKATTVAAMTVAVHEKIILVSKSFNSFPIGPFLPQISSKKKPRTVGGKIRGRVKMPSINPLNLPL